ncbi:hypothetical protein CFP75_11255 [Amycolatopsis alba DSM 44262]|uniref:Uncharacterized protein n=1 Tax=Amycolatopsis alba DSM 44262 TaxID=1125972 RepID=A0A229RZS7_AMYAL|nr:hypothetical protein CFP75_11255 [Amycolatopsis alba DSM 44262]
MTCQERQSRRRLDPLLRRRLLRDVALLRDARLLRNSGPLRDATRPPPRSVKDSLRDSESLKESFTDYPVH